MKKAITLATALALFTANVMAQTSTLEIRGTINYGYTLQADARTEFDNASFVIEVNQKPMMPLVYAATTWRQYGDALTQINLSIQDADGNDIVVKQPLAPADLTPTSNLFYIDYGRYNDFASWVLNGITNEGLNSRTSLSLQGPRTYLFASTDDFPSFISQPRYSRATLSSSLETTAGAMNVYLQGSITSVEQPTQDNDNDGVLDDGDTCPGSDIRAIVQVGANDSGVTNSVDGAGCSIADHVKACFAEANNHGDSVSCVSHLATELRKSGLISGRDQGQLLRSL